MKSMVSSVGVIEGAAVTTIKRLATRMLDQQRAKSVPSVGLVSNVDPDQRTFLTAPMQGLTMVQTQGSGILAIFAEYGVKPSGQTLPFMPVPGQPVLIYPAAASSPALNTSFIHGGKETVERDYPARLLWRGSASAIVEG